ncbi:UBX domain containing protein [Entamoeba histolytica HM-1:IMSS-B]|uniref:UBX domain protein n=6 Tax=Entamoeba histolytica TaxID=5759 RepID=C4M305_ENTH1|nr:UBX domain protein [Entamoeba histolytica HM-1:IMSS]EMD46357.1 UBX domain containing protein [Entamoeba histolytica KU27]EMH77778.1 UBX domain containing protein [Entamoeba histolytica HM-1:IMSS-B]EMS13056.1 UBX domain containing protein [Entamoeba histolytica HM-3:IMSS]ENY64903.1 UBX domain containing protein [Entamoeba histolytica HM-1:IMSS-A]GAT95679.1 ubx domain protein [Entamoeba histolytica]|eukprot:XP_653557.1 UBX domain protein [Entamoeba histolytica HM-1:IMSS]
MSIKWSTPAGIPSVTNYDNKIGKQDLPKPTLSPNEYNLQVILPKITPLTPVQSYPDSFYELTPNEAKILMQPTQKPDHLVSKSYQEDQRIIRNSKYKKTTIKIKFPDNTELIRCFHPLQTTHDIYNFIEESLRLKVKYALKLSTGKRDLIKNDEQTLAKLNLVPGAILLIVFEDYKSVEKPYLRKELMSLATEKK